MSFFSKLSSQLFKSKTSTKESSKKTDRLENISLDELMAVIQNAKDDQLRNSAVQKINQLSNLLTLADINSGKTSVTSLQKSAKKRIAQLLDASEISSAEFCKSVEDPIQRFAILGLMTDSSLADAELAAIQDEALLTRIVLEATSSRLRQAAAERVQQAENLFLLLKECKNADKSVYKIIKEKCDLIKAEEKKQQDLAAEQTHLIASLEQHAQRVYDIHYAPKFLYLQQQWQAFAQANGHSVAAEINARVQSAIEHCAEKVIQHQAEEQAEENLRKALASADQHLQELMDSLEQLLIDLVSGNASDDEVRQKLDAWRTDWENSSSLKEPSKALKANAKQLEQVILIELKARTDFGTLKEHSFRLELHINNQSPEEATFHQSLLDRIENLKHFKLLITEFFNLAEAACEKASKKQSEQLEEMQTRLRQLAGLVRKVKEALDSGELKKATSLRSAIEEKRAAIQNLPAHLTHQIEHLDESIEKLKDWKAYAVAPKKLELISQMEVLSTSSLHPEVRAERIKHLQDEWKQLSKGVSDQEQWEKFHQLAQKAYEPCQIYFAEQAALRAANLEQCKKLVQQLKDYLQPQNWDAFDWRAAEQVMRVARQEWRSYSPTERAATQPVLAEFESCLEQVHQKILQEQTRIANLKQALIERATQLANAEDLRKSIDAVKTLQVEWQALGVCGHKQEQQLWQSFRQACDQVFAKRQQQSAEFKAELDANHHTAKQLRKNLEDLVALTGKELFDARAQVEEIRKSVSGLGQLPKAVAQDIRTQFQSLFQSFDEKLKTERAKEKQQIWINLFAAADRIRAFELSLKQAEKATATKEDLQTYLQALNPLPSGGLKALQQKLEQVNDQTDPQSNELRLRRLCISAELLNELASPVSDQKLRQAIQVENLQNNFGKKIHNQAHEMESLVFEWLQIGAVEDSEYQELVARFNQCLVKSLKAKETVQK